MNRNVTKDTEKCSNYFENNFVRINLTIITGKSNIQILIEFFLISWLPLVINKLANFLKKIRNLLKV